MATTQQLEAIAARLLPDIAPSVALSQTNLFLARVMSAGNWEENKIVQDHFGKSALRAVLDAPPEKIFDRPSWTIWHAAFDLQPKEMPDSFFTVYPWFRDRAKQINREATSELLSNLQGYEKTPVRSCDELEVA